MISRKPTDAHPLLRSQWKVFFVLMLVVGLAFCNAFQAGLVVDNDAIINEDSRLRAVSSENLWLIFSEDYWYPTGVGGIYRPLVTLSFLFEYSVLGNKGNPVHYHWINLGFHWLNACLVFLLLLRLTKAFWIAFGSSTLFAVHPITTEAVTNIVGRSDLFATASVLMGVLLYIQGRQPTSYWKWSYFALMAVVAMLGILSKENAIVIAALVPLFGLIYERRREKLQEAFGIRSIQSWFWQGYVWLVPVIVGFIVIRIALFHQHGPSLMAWIDNSLRATDFVSARLTAVKIIGHYLWVLVVPLHLSCDYSMNTIPNCSWHMTSFEDWKAIAALFLIVSLFFVAWRRFKKDEKSSLFFLGWFFIALLPTSNLILLIDSNMAERFLYLPLVGFVGFVIPLLNTLLSRIHRHAMMAVLAPILCLACLRTQNRNADWESHLSIWTSAVENCPESLRAAILAWSMIQEQPESIDFDRIIDVAKKADQILRGVPDEESDSATYLDLGKYYGMKADSLSTRDAQGSIALTEESRKIYEQSLAHLQRAKEIDDAVKIKQKRNLLSIGWNDDEFGEAGTPEVYEDLALTFARLGRLEEAAETLFKLQSIRPASAIVYRSLPDKLSRLSRLREAGIVLLQGMLLGFQDEQSVQQLKSLYDKLNTDQSPAFIGQGHQTAINLANPIIRADLDQAILNLIELALRTKDMGLAERGREAARNHSCHPGPIDELFKRLGPKHGKWHFKKLAFDM